jgi:hypothetical protein
VFWDVALHHWVTGCHCFEGKYSHASLNDGDMFPRNASLGDFVVRMSWSVLTQI